MQSENVFQHILANGCDDGFIPAESAQSTEAQPGSPAKVAVMAARVLQGQELFQDGDVTVLPDEFERCLDTLTDRVRHKVHTGRKANRRAI